jgi:hypothetical protein
VAVVAASTVTYVTAAAVALNGGGGFADGGGDLANGCGIFGEGCASCEDDDNG